MIFCMQISMEVSYKLIVWFLMQMVKHSQSSQNSKLAMSLQCSKKEVRYEVDFFHADKHQSFHKLTLSFFMQLTKHVQTTQNIKLVIFYNILRKNCRNCFCVLLWWKTFKYFMGIQSCLLLLVLFQFGLKLEI